MEGWLKHRPARDKDMPWLHSVASGAPNLPASDGLSQTPASAKRCGAHAV